MLFVKISSDGRIIEKLLESEHLKALGKNWCQWNFYGFALSYPEPPYLRMMTGRVSKSYFLWQRENGAI